MSDIVEILESYIETSTYRGFAEVDHSDIVTAQQTIIAFRAKMDDLRGLVARLKYAIAEERVAVEAELKEEREAVRELQRELMRLTGGTMPERALKQEHP